MTNDGGRDPKIGLFATTNSTSAQMHTYFEYLTITDRNGVVLATNYSAFTLEITPSKLEAPIEQVLDAAWAYADATGRRISIEYALIRDINDQAWRADLLGDLLAGHLVHVNLIPLNPTPGSKWTASRPQDEAEFVRILGTYGVPVTVRDTRGREIDGACGQLAAAEVASEP